MFPCFKSISFSEFIFTAADAKRVRCSSKNSLFHYSADCSEIDCLRKNPKISDTQTFAVITVKVEQDGFSLE